MDNTNIGPRLLRAATSLRITNALNTARVLPPSREQALVVTKLQEADMWMRALETIEQDKETN